MSPRYRARRSHDALGGGSDLHVGGQRRHQFSSALNLDGGSRGVKQKVEFSSQQSLHGAHRRGRRRSRTPTRQRTLAFDTSCQPTRRRLPRSGTSRGIEPRTQRVLETHRLPTATTQSADGGSRTLNHRRLRSAALPLAHDRERVAPPGLEPGHGPRLRRPPLPIGTERQKVVVPAGLEPATTRFSTELLYRLGYDTRSVVTGGVDPPSPVLQTGAKPLSYATMQRKAGESNSTDALRTD